MSENTVCILGDMGNFGAPLREVLAKIGFEVTGIDIERERDGDYIARACEIDPDALILALPPEKIGSLFPEYAAALRDRERIWINMDVSQSHARNLLIDLLSRSGKTHIIVNIFPHFGPENLEDLSDQKIIFCGVDAVGGGMGVGNYDADVWVEQILEAFSRLTRSDRPLRLINLARRPYRATFGGISTNRFIGVGLYDLISLHAQLPYHVLRQELARNDQLAMEIQARVRIGLDLEWERTSRVLTDQIIRQNPFSGMGRIIEAGEELTMYKVRNFLQNTHMALSHFREALFPQEEDHLFLCTPETRALLEWVYGK